MKKSDGGKKNSQLVACTLTLPYTCRGSASDAAHLSIIIANPLISTGIIVSFELPVCPKAVMSELRGSTIVWVNVRKHSSLSTGFSH